MDLGGAAPLPPGKMDGCFDNDEERRFFGLVAKDEPMDIIECCLNDLGEREDLDLCAQKESEILVFESEDNVSESIDPLENTLVTPNKNLSSAVLSSELPVMRKLIINGQAKTCIIVNNPALRQNIMESIGSFRAGNTASNPQPQKNTTNPLVKCFRCGSEIHIDAFRQHIDTCPPRKPGSRKTGLTKENAVSQADQIQTVQAMYNPSTGEVATLASSPLVIGNTNFKGVPATIHSSQSSQRGEASPCDLTEDMEITESPSTSTKPNMIRYKKTMLSCNKCDFSSSTLLAIHIHMKEHWDNFKMSSTPHQNIETVSVVPKNKNLATSTEDSNSGFVSTEKVIIQEAGDVEMIPGTCTTMTNESRTGNVIDKNPLATTRKDEDTSTDETDDADENVKEVVFSSCEMLLNGCNNENVGSPQAVDPLRISKSTRTRSKSFSANHAENQSNSGPTFSPTHTRSEGMFIYQSVLGGDHESENIEEASNQDQQQGDLEVTDPSKGFFSSRSVTSRSPSIEEEGKIENGLDNISDLYSDSNLTICQDLDSKTSDGFGKMLGNSNFESAFASVNVSSVTDDLFLLQDNTFSCSKCSFTTDRKSRLNDHERNHRKNNLPIFSCTYCNQKYTRYMLYLHVQNVHPGQTFQIRDEGPDGVCPKKLHNCTGCSFSSDNPAKFKLHLQTHAVTTSERGTRNRQIRSCELCSYSTIYPSSIKEHMITHLNNRPIKQCLMCNYKSTPQALAFHIAKCSKISTSKESVDGSVKSKGTRAKHKGTHRIKKAMLKLHSRTDPFEPVQRTDESGRLFFDCRLCSHGTSRFSDMVHHVNSHRKNVPILKCPGCDFKSTPRALLFHKRKCQTGSAKGLYESNEVQIKGSVDSSAAKSKGAIAKPQRTHRMKANLKLHSRTDWFVQRTDESGRRFFDCRLCSYGSSRINNMVDHVSSHSKNMPILKCPGCDFQSTPRALSFHKRKCQTGSAKGLYEHNEVEVKGSVDSSAAKSKGAIAMPQRTHGISRTDPFEPVQRTDESGRIFFDCRLCSYVGSQFTKMVYHVNSHRKNVPILKCPGCDFKSTPRALFFHKRKCQTGSAKGLYEPNEVEIKESVDSSAAKSKGAIAMPQRTHGISRTDPFEPVQRTDESGGIFFDCRLCSYVGSRFTKMVLHVNSHRKNVPILKCPGCDFKSTPRAVLFHKRKCQTGSAKGTSGPNEMEVKGSVDSSAAKSKGAIAKPQRTHRIKKSKLKLHSRTDRFVQRTDESGRRFFDCRLCSYGASRIDYMVDHVSSHRKNPPILKCPGCDFKSTPRALFFHKRKCQTGSAKGLYEPNEVEVKGSVDSSAAKSKGAIAMPQRTHGLSQTDPFEPVQRTDESGHLFFDCRLCSYVGSRFTKMVRHVNSHRKNVPILKCSGCDFKSTPHALLFHKRKCQTGSSKGLYEPNEFEVKGSVDSSAAKSKGAIAKPQRTHGISRTDPFEPVQRTDESGRLFFDCRLCSYVVPYFTKMVQHVNSHRKNVPILKCSGCDFKSTPHPLYYHKRKCQTGSAKSTSGPNEVEIEQKTHDAVNTEPKFPIPTHAVTTSERGAANRRFYSCELCSYNTKNPTNIKKHMTSHLNNRPINQCCTCNYKSTPQALVYHVANCPKKSASKGSVDSLQLHSGTDPFEPVQRTDESGRLCFDCRLCSYGNSRFSQMVHHVNSHRKNVPILKCSGCDFKSTPHPLYYHEQKCHTGSAKSTSGPNEIEIKGNVDSSAAKSKGDIAKPQMTHRIKKAKLKLHSRTDGFVQRTDESGRLFFDCRLCSYGTSRFFDMVNHVNSHRKNVPILKCSGCDFKSTPHALYYHKQKCQTGSAKSTSGPNEIEIKGSVDSSAAKSKGAIAKPQMIHRIKKAKLKLRSRSDRFVKRTDDSGCQFFDCRLCSYGTSYFTDMVGHVNTHRKNVPILKCSGCDFKSTSRVLLFHKRKCQTGSAKGTSGLNEIDMEQKSRGAVNTEPKAVFKCTQCSFVTFLRIKLKLHIRKRHLKPRNVAPEVSAPILNCPRCSFSTVSSAELELHQEKCFAATENEFKCNLCSVVTKLKHHWEDHMKSHARHLPILKCPGCSFKSIAKLLRKHMDSSGHRKGVVAPAVVESSSSYEVVYKCKLCTFTSSDRLTYMNHKSKHNSINGFKCKLCSLVCSHASHLSYHMNSHRSKRPLKKCTKCNFKSTPLALVRHIRDSKHYTNCSSKKIDPNKMPDSATKSTFKCSLCPFSSSLRIKLNSHVKKYHNQIKKEHGRKSGKLFQCNYCSYAASIKNNIEKHLNTHFKWKMPVQKCQNCDYRSTATALKIHFKDCQKNQAAKNSENNKHVPENKPKPLSKNVETVAIVEANEAGSEYVSEGDYHQPPIPGDSMGSPEMFACTLCSYTTRRKEDLQKHLLFHQKNPEIQQCPCCSYKATPMALVFHMKCENHSNEMAENEKKRKRVTERVGRTPYICQYCSFTSFVPYAMERHMNSHTLLKLPVKQCEKCPFRSTPAALSAHRKGCTGKVGSPSKKFRHIDSGVYNSKDTLSDTPKIKAKSPHVKSLLKECQISPTENVLEEESGGMISVNTAASDGSPKAVFNCPKCPFATSLRIKLKFHVQKNHLVPKARAIVRSLGSSKRFKKCKYCSYIGKSYDMDKHEETHTIRKWPIKKCPKCAFRSTQSALKSHMIRCS